jgi:metallophosphoesterase (TIGR00282 family)
MAVNILCIGDVVGKPGRKVLSEHLPRLINELKVELVVCNGENAAGGSGLTPQLFKKLLGYGIDVITLGDHVYRKVEIVSQLNESARLIRPANLSDQAAGKGWTVVQSKCGLYKVAVICLLGQLYMRTADSPWAAIDRILAEIPADVHIRLVDFHAEATSEKIAMGWHLNGRVSAVFGTHTHVPTADARVLDKQTAYISDLGMTGPYESVLGRRVDRVLHALTTSMPASFQVARGDPRICGALIAVDPNTGKAESIERIEVAGEAVEGPICDADDGRPDQP